MAKDARLTRRDETLVDLLVRTGLGRNVARVLVFLSKKEETTSVDIEKATGLRQPEVSIVMQDLRARAWVTKRDVKKEGKGRPVHAYRLAMPFRDVVELVARDERRKIEDIESVVKQIRRRAR